MLSFFIISFSFKVPRFRYCRNAKKFVPLRASTEEDVNSLLPSSPLCKSFLLAHRYEVRFFIGTKFNWNLCFLKGFWINFSSTAFPEV